MKNIKRIMITSGEPAGIGLDIISIIAQKTWPVELIVCGDASLLMERSMQLKLPIKLHTYNKKTIPSPTLSGELTILDIKSPTKVIPGILDPINSKYVIKILKRACNGCLNGEFAALVTGPVHKGVINDAGITFIGQTEFLAKYSGKKKVIMMLINNKLRIALATTHIPIFKVPKIITNKLLNEIIPILVYNLKKNFNITEPIVYVCGLNPHAGENGYIGKEEIKTIIPSLNKLRSKGFNLVGPLPADTIFQTKYLKNADAILAMYHDQGLPVIKYKNNFGRSVNITLGLPFIRTSVDHGTALELAGSGNAKADSMIAAIKLAIQIIKRTL
ncbi:4-hydroxythreonine-4-phosphate dehydrogenase PdxA [Blochmannia endosymbiont of Colobopsis nipponica]|uniref:4-hydroxythreonine-4-phosphate dehydrogenase PdxA n=1 Tax=Blochmannia endosymbiont of Colobopsis nipponica TaxID=2681987 RepID=UPI00177BA5BA|nr:4-hydroxythreonine-4-phosphate dehydrogenase PdxA [Blochmannia endosymbiont of Colobopsis nipponica]QOI11280.1 4-hydroxythreonine-4-phosphate dehydrogenase PdxA [Blochmannia endosymbiont of Colobopsis nipponica]